MGPRGVGSGGGCMFPSTAITKCQELGGLKQKKCIVSVLVARSSKSRWVPPCLFYLLAARHSLACSSITEFSANLLPMSLFVYLLFV